MLRRAGQWTLTCTLLDSTQRGGPGVLTNDIGKEEVGSKAENWPLVDSSSFEAPLSMYNDASTMAATPDVSASGTGYILRYNDPALYSPVPSVCLDLALRGSGGVHSRWPSTRSTTATCA